MTENNRIAFGSLGCKLNQAETEVLARQLAAAGYELVSTVEEANVYVLNTCTVTHIADRKSRHLLRQAYRRNPDIRTVAIGCYAEGAPSDLTGIDGVAMVLDNGQKPQLLRRLEEAGCLSRPPAPPVAPPVNGRRARAFVKVQEGCRGACAYCIVPLVRKNENSLADTGIIRDIKQLVAEGVKETVLTGTEIGRYNYRGVNLAGLVRRLLAETSIARLRLSSLQPPEVSPELIELWRDHRLCPHFHLSLQSGSDAVLGRMRRGYTRHDYREAVSLVRAARPEAAVTTDIIVGFPGETDEEFRESLDFCRRMEFSRIHVFAYSPRRGTEAAGMPCQVGASVKKWRSRQMLALAAECAGSFNRKFLGRTLPVLWEKREKGDKPLWSGHTDNYIKVYAGSDRDLTGQIIPVRLENLWKDGVRGELI